MSALHPMPPPTRQTFRSDGLPVLFDDGELSMRFISPNVVRSKLDWMRNRTLEEIAEVIADLEADIVEKYDEIQALEKEVEELSNEH